MRYDWEGLARKRAVRRASMTLKEKIRERVEDRLSRIAYGILMFLIKIF